MKRASSKRIDLSIALVTGFAPFGGETINPSLEIARTLDGELIAGHRVVGAELPSEFAQSLPVLDALIDKHHPAIVIALGQAGGRAGISLERVAINLMDARIADNAGEQPIDAPVLASAPNAYFSTLPVKAALARLRTAGIPAALSQSAGTFICNQVFFGLLHRLTTQHAKARGGFIHVPYLPEQAARFVDTPSMALETMVKAIRLSLEIALTTHADVHYAAGTTH